MTVEGKDKAKDDSYTDGTEWVSPTQGRQHTERHIRHQGRRSPRCLLAGAGREGWEDALG